MAGPCPRPLSPFCGKGCSGASRSQQVHLQVPGSYPRKAYASLILIPRPPYSLPAPCDARAPADSLAPLGGRQVQARDPAGRHPPSWGRAASVSTGCGPDDTFLLNGAGRHGIGDWTRSVVHCMNMHARNAAAQARLRPETRRAE